MKRVIAVISMLALFAMAGCGIDEPEPPVFQTTLALLNSGGEETDVFYQGETITMVLSFENLTEEPQAIAISNPVCDFLVFDEGNGENVWGWAYGKLWIASIEFFYFIPGETKSWQVDWDQTDYTNTPVAAGSYYAQGYMWTTREIKNDRMLPTETRSWFVPFTIE